ncbi:hypothetical protein BLNAU_15442 [Blattamonas nauphoetae]|uniref:Protein kinase domain-containing protein n=1 Tax=Blattamonas nauphoetae TaxID=2049346 RepID=A0ABQ9XAM6_9EUKA|nr:hypothetical protein BLNAU_15442 [Blattamonas nauphoetae]
MTDQEIVFSVGLIEKIFFAYHSLLIGFPPRPTGPPEIPPSASPSASYGRDFTTARIATTRPARPASRVNFVLTNDNYGTIIVCAMILSIKYLRDKPFSNTCWAETFAIPVQTLNQSELIVLIHPRMLPLTVFFVVGRSFDWHQHPVVALSDVIEEQVPNVEHTELSPVIHLNPGTHHGTSVPVSCRWLKLVGQEATTLVHSSLLPHHSIRPNYANTKEFPREQLYYSILEIVNSTVEMTCVHAILSTETPIHPKPFSNIITKNPPYLSTIVSSTVSVSECSISVPEAQSPFLLTSESSDSSSTSLRIVETRFLASKSFLGPLTHVLPSANPSSISLTLASSSFSSTTLTNGNSLAFGLEPHTSRVDDNWEISSQIVSSHFSNVTSTKDKPLCIPSQLSQWSLGNSISNSVGALQGTILEDFNLGGTFLSLNTSFSHCESTPSPSLDIIVTEYYSHFLRRILRRSRPPYTFNNVSLDDSEGFSFYALFLGSPYPPQQSYFYATQANPISFTDCSFKSMSRSPEIYDQNGLALFLQTTAPLTVTNCSFSDMRSERGEGLAITTVFLTYQPPHIVHIEDCTFSNCHSEYPYSYGGGGGAVHLGTYGFYTISTSSFSECSTLNGNGGACYCLGCSISFSTFESNSAVKGGAFYGQTDCSIFFSHFQNNTAQTDTDWAFNSTVHVVFGCTESADDWTIGDSLIVVSGDGEGTDCTKDSPCGTLENALTKANAEKVFTINVCPGSFEPTTIPSTNEMLTIRGHYPLDTVKSASRTTTFALTIDGDSSVTVKDFILSPLEEHHLVECHSTKTIVLSGLQIVNVESVTVPLFNFSAGLISLKDSQLENITSADCPLVRIATSAKFSMSAVLFRNIVSADCVISIVSGGTCTISDCVFHKLTRTEGVGAAAIDAEEFGRIDVNSIFSHCISQKGRVGALFLSHSSKPDYAFIHGTYVNNEGEKANDAHDILLSGFKLSDTNQWSFMSVFSMSQSPSIVENGEIHPDPSPPTDMKIVDDDDWFFHLKDGSQVLLWSDFLELDFDILTSQQDQDINLNVWTRREEEFLIHQSRLDAIIRFTGKSMEPQVTTIRQASDSIGSLFTLTTERTLAIEGFKVFLDCQQTDPMITLDSSSTVSLRLVSVSSDGREMSRPFIQSMGKIYMSETSFVNMAFKGTSCIECHGGLFYYQPQYSDAVRCAANLTTDVDGAFLNAQNTEISAYSSGPFLNCRARNGGAIFLQNCSCSMSCVFVGCSASQNGGGLWMEYNHPEKRQTSLHVNFVNCSAERGGGVFFQVTRPFSLSLQTGSAYVFLPQPFAMFLNCSAKKGAGIFLDGVCSAECDLDLSRFTSSNGDCFCEGSDIFISKSFAESLPTLPSVLSTLKTEGWSLSSQSLSTGTRHVHIEDDLEQSFNLEPQQFIVEEERYNSNAHCPISKNEKCPNISPMFEFFHTKNENGSFVQIPILVKDKLFFFETAFVERQSALLTRFDKTADPPTATTFQKGDDADSQDSVLLLISNDGLISVVDLKFVWKAEIGLCEVVSPTAEMTIEACHFELDIDLFSSLIMCRAGSVRVLGSQFTTTNPTRPILSPIIATSPSTIAVVSNSARSDIKIEMDDASFSAILTDSSVRAIVSIDGGHSIGLSHVSFEKVKKLPLSDDAVRISVRGWDLSNVIASKRESGFPSLDSDESSLYTSLDLNEPSESRFSSPTLLVYLTFYSNSQIFVGSAGRDIASCGGSFILCHGLDEAAEHLSVAAPSTMMIEDEAQLEQELDLGQDNTLITARGDSCEVRVLEGGSLVNDKTGSVSHLLTLSRLHFSLSSTRSTSLLKSKSGTLTIDACSFSSSSSSISSHPLLEAFVGSVKIMNVELHTPEWTSGTMFSFEGRGASLNVTFTTCNFAGSSQSSQSADNEEINICEWSSGLVSVVNSSLNLFSTTFSHLSQGAIRVVDGNVTLSEDSFSRNSAQNASFPSARRNMHCSGTSVVNMKLNTADSATQTSLWILTDDSCVVRDEDVVIQNPFFVPTLSRNDSSSKFEKKTSEYLVHLGGTLLIPCDMSLIVREVSEKGEPKSLAIPLTQFVATDHTESSIDISVNTSHFSHFDQKLEWIGLVGFGRSGETDSFTFKLSQRQALAESMRKTLPWLIPLIVSLALLLLVGFVLFIVFRKRFLKKNTESKEMKEEVQEVFEVEKVEMDGTQQGVHANDPDAIISKDVVTAEQDLNDAESSLIQPVVLLEAVICGEKLEKTVVREEDTLYNALHRKECKIPIVKSTVRQQIVTGLRKVAQTNSSAPILSKLSSHWVMFDGAGNVCLKLQDAPPRPNESVVKAVEDGQRWAAPELIKEEAVKELNVSVNAVKASVFSLGLVLWELETGQVPFQEQDAVNAQRQLGTGVLPKMAGMQKELTDLITECLSLNPDDRPSLASVASLLQTLPEPSHENEKDNPESVRPQS